STSRAPLPRGVSASRIDGAVDPILEHLRAEVALRVRRPAASISLDDGLARLGLDSLKAVELVAALERHHGISLPATLLFEVRTLREAAQALRALLTDEGRGDLG
ncbi:acyl carrier protein, partial [Myxococcota bacterium]|nr:acyl carrier protein [Myxococcota bacterium]